MADRRMFTCKIFQSSVMVRLGYDNGEFGLAAQRIFETLILDADDYGRGRLIPEILRGSAFLSTPEIFIKVTPEMILAWVKQIEKQGALIIYEVNGEKYYNLTGWNKYQRGDWQRGVSLLPDPPSQQLDDSEGTVKEQITDCSDEIKLKESKVKEIKLKEFSPEVLAFTADWFAGKDKVDLDAQADSLDKLTRIDGFPQDEVFKVLTWVKSGTDQEAEFWRGVIGSFVPLRENKKGRRCNKYLNCRASYEKTMRAPGMVRKQMEDCDGKFKTTGDIKL